MELSPTLQEFLRAMTLFGWIWIIPVVERLIPMHGQKLFRPGIINDLVHTYHPIHLWSFAAASLSAWLAAWAQNNVGQTLPLQGVLADAHWATSLVAVFLMGHFTFYGFHWLSHKIPLLWEFHRVHHSSLNLDSFSTSRFHIFDKFLFAAPYLCLVTYFQPDPGTAFLYISFRDFWGRYGHANIRDPHWLGYFMSNPKFHRWHHSNNPEAIDKNFSAEFNFLDYLFGTAYYPDEGMPENFGEADYSNNILIQHYRPFQEIYKIAKRDGIMALFRKPRPISSKPAGDELKAVHE